MKFKNWKSPENCVKKSEKLEVKIKKIEQIN